MSETPIRKPANVNVSPVGNQGNKPQSNVLPNKKSAAPFGSVDKSAYVRKTAGTAAMTTPGNDKDAGNGTGSLRKVKKASAIPIYKGVD